jgi:AbrB family looped-hinge helix DNA binding protein
LYIKKLNKKGQITIPKKILKLLKVNDGDYLTIYQQKEVIVIKNKHPNKQLNQCVINNGRISIPAEIRNILKIHAESALLVDVSARDEVILVKQD